jgi:UDP-2-acetamido-3-amino-2,3-dideoxy-glucuronate N-acetyltransferase
MNGTNRKKKTWIAVIGSGYWGKNLVRNFNQIGALRLICDRSEITLENFRKQYHGVKTCLALTDVLNDKTIKGVAIATPAETHYGLVKEALLGDKNVYVEKPLVLDESEAEELIEIASKRNLVLMVGHLIQYHPVFVKLKKLTGNGELGRINYIYSHRLNLGKIRREENILWSFAPHDISMILSLTGEVPNRTFATGGNYLHKQIADVTTTHMEFPSGLKAHIFVSWLHPFKEQKLVVVGDKKMAVFDDTLPWEDKLLLYPHQINWQNNSPIPIKGDPERVDILQDEPLKLECQHFLDCIANGTKPITDGFEGLRVLKVLNDAQRSLDMPLETGQKPSGHKQKRKEEFFVHASAVLDEGCKIGKGTKIWHFSHILANSVIGRDCNLGQNVVVGPDTTIGNHCKIQNNVSVYKGVTLEEGVFCGPSMVFTNIYNPRAEIRKMDQVRPTLVKKGATLGANCTIICGTTIGRYAFVGAGAVVNRNIQDHALMVGNPARQLGWVCECGERLSEDLTCLSCGNIYEKSSEGLTEMEKAK